MGQPMNQSIKPPPKTRLYMTGLLVLAIIVASAIYIGANPITFFANAENMLDLIVRMFPPDWGYFITVTPAMLDTIRIALIGTTFGAIMSVPIMFLCSRNVATPVWLHQTSRILLNILRTVPDLLLAAIFAAILGFTPLAGMVALSIFSIGIIAKLSFEAIENIEQGPLEAMTAVGANKIQWIVFGVVPQILPQFTTYVLYTFEINVRAAAILGLVGAGGIGLFYNQALNFFLIMTKCFHLFCTLCSLLLLLITSA